MSQSDHIEHIMKSISGIWLLGDYLDLAPGWRAPGEKGYLFASERRGREENKENED